MHSVHASSLEVSPLVLETYPAGHGILKLFGLNSLPGLQIYPSAHPLLAGFAVVSPLAHLYPSVQGEHLSVEPREKVPNGQRTGG